MFTKGRFAIGLVLAGLLAAGLVAYFAMGRESKPSGSPKKAMADTASTVPEADLFVEGNLYFLALHEFGHAMVSEFELPIAGREEDAVDRLATWILTPQDDEESPDYLLDAADGWFSLGDQTPIDEIAWWDEHGTDQQRGYQIACLLYGSNPKRFADVAESVELPAERRESCEEEAGQNDVVWDKLLKPHYRPESAPAPLEEVKIDLQPSSKYAQERSLLLQIELFESLRETMVKDYRFKPGIRLSAKECGESNASWDPEERHLVVCYELVADYRAMSKSIDAR